MRVISGKAKGVVLKTPDGMQTRPTSDRVKEALFSILQFDLPGTKVLDLFGGTGQLGIEAISRGAKSAVFVDAAEAPCKLIKENLRRARMEEEGRVVRSDYLTFLSNCRETYDIILLGNCRNKVLAYLKHVISDVTDDKVLSMISRLLHKNTVHERNSDHIHDWIELLSCEWLACDHRITTLFNII